MNQPDIGSDGREGPDSQGPGSPPRPGDIEARNKRVTSTTPSTARSVSQSTLTDEGPPPPLPPRPVNLDLLGERPITPGDSLQKFKSSARPSLQATATTGLSLTDVHTQSYPDGSRETSESTSSRRSPKDFGSIRRFKNWYGSEGDESASLRSYAPTLEAGGDVESLLGEVLGASSTSPAWGLLSNQPERLDPFETINFEDNVLTADFNREFDEIGEIDLEGNNEGNELLDLTMFGVDRANRRPSGTLEVKAKALPHTLFCWQTYLQPSWRRQLDIRAHWSDPNHHLIL